MSAHGFAPDPRRPGVKPTSSMVRPPASPTSDSTLETVGSSYDPRVNLRKTQFCKNTANKGVCRFGAKCLFAHSEVELTSPPDWLKTRLCQNFSVGKCLDDACKFAHGYDELRTAEGSFKKSLCLGWAKGHCKYGSSCRFAHGEQELRSEPSGIAAPLSLSALLEQPATAAAQLYVPVVVGYVAVPLGSGNLPVPVDPDRFVAGRGVDTVEARACLSDAHCEETYEPWRQPAMGKPDLGRWSVPVGPAWPAPPHPCTAPVMSYSGPRPAMPSSVPSSSSDAQPSADAVACSIHGMEPSLPAALEAKKAALAGTVSDLAAASKRALQKTKNFERRSRKQAQLTQSADHS